jgi:thymidylate synthase
MKQYKDMLQNVYLNGTDIIHPRTGISCRKLFGHQMRFDLQETFPLVSIKQTGWKTILTELIWMLRGDTNTEYLHEHGVTIWDEWQDENGDLGPIYGKQWRNFGGVDQIEEVIKSLIFDPHGRRHIVSAWNPAELDKMALPPCHAFFQFFVSKDKLSCQLYQRSVDVVLGLPYNIAAYSMLTHIIAKICGYQVGEFIHTSGDYHIYHNQMNEDFHKLMNRTPIEQKIKFELPYFISHFNSVLESSVDDYRMIGYNHQGKLSFPVAI